MTPRIMSSVQQELERPPARRWAWLLPRSLATIGVALINSFNTETALSPPGSQRMPGQCRKYPGYSFPF